MDPADFGPTTQLDSAASRDGLPPGTILGGFRVVEVLGRGSSSVVYLALDSSLQRQVAIKEYLPADLAERGPDLSVSLKRGADPARFADGVNSFLQRAKVLARLEHPALPRVHGFWQEHQTAYMTLSYREGQSLAAVLEEMQEPPDEAWLRALLAPLLGALELLHAAKCAHDGISADNILVQADGSPVLLGLGAARRVADDPTRPAGPWTDLNALARVVHVAIGGEDEPAASGSVDRSPPSFVDTALDMQARFPRLNYSAPFLACIDAALSGNPRRRLTSVAEFRRRLALVPPASRRGAATTGAALPTSHPASRTPMPPMTAANTRGRRVWATTLGAAVLLAAGGWWWVQAPAGMPIANASTPPSAPAIERLPDAAPPPEVVQALPAALVPPAPEPSGSEPETPVSTSRPPPAAVPAAPAEPDNPRAACGNRTNFALYYCMQNQCKRPSFVKHRQCVELRDSDTVR